MEKQQDCKTLNIFNADSDRCGFVRRTETDSSMSFLFSSAWLIRRTIQSNRALYSDLAMESRAVIACTNDTRLATKHLDALLKAAYESGQALAHLAVAVGQNQLVVYGHRFPLGKSLHQQLLLNLDENSTTLVKLILSILLILTFFIKFKSIHKYISV